MIVIFIYLGLSTIASVMIVAASMRSAQISRYEEQRSETYREKIEPAFVADILHDTVAF